MTQLFQSSEKFNVKLKFEYFQVVRIFKSDLKIYIVCPQTVGDSGRGEIPPEE